MCPCSLLWEIDQSAGAECSRARIAALRHDHTENAISFTYLGDSGPHRALHKMETARYVF